MVSPDYASSEDAADLIIKAARQSGPLGLTIVTLGPPSNLAGALSKAPDIAPLLRRVVLMGGQLDAGGKMCLNFMSDRAAVRAVLDSPVPTMLVPIQTCAQASFTTEHVARLEAKCHCEGEEERGAACALAPKMKAQTKAMPWLVNQHVTRRQAEWALPPSAKLATGFIPWDVVAMLAAFRPKLFDSWQMHRVRVPGCAPEAEPCNGTMVVERSSIFDAEPDVAARLLAGPADREAHRGLAMVPHRIVSEEALLDAAIDLLCAVPAKGEFKDANPPYLFGFLREVGAVAGLLALVLVLGGYRLEKSMRGAGSDGRRTAGQRMEAHLQRRAELEKAAKAQAALQQREKQD